MPNLLYGIVSMVVYLNRIYAGFESLLGALPDHLHFRFDQGG